MAVASVVAVLKSVCFITARASWRAVCLLTTCSTVGV